MDKRKVITKKEVEILTVFMNYDDQEQRAFFDSTEKLNKADCHHLLRGLFKIVSDNNVEQNELIFYCLCHLDGILEDKRTRIKFYVEIMNDFKEGMDLVGILISFLRRCQQQSLRDIASHVLVLIIDAEKNFEKISK